MIGSAKCDSDLTAVDARCRCLLRGQLHRAGSLPATGRVRLVAIAPRTRPPRDARLDRLDVLAPNGPVVLVIAGMTLVGISQGSPSGSTTSVNVFQAQEAIGRAMEPAMSA